MFACLCLADFSVFSIEYATSDGAGSGGFQFSGAGNCVFCGRE
jgi:hypothetical protein